MTLLFHVLAFSYNAPSVRCSWLRLWLRVFWWNAEQTWLSSDSRSSSLVAIPVPRLSRDRFPPQYTFYILTRATLQADLSEREKIVIETAKLAASSRSSILCIEPNLQIALLCSLSFVISYLEQQIKKHYLNPQPWLQNQRNIIVYLWKK